MHYNAAGNALVADVVIKSLMEEPPVKRQRRNSGRGLGEGLALIKLCLC